MAKRGTYQGAHFATPRSTTPTQYSQPDSRRPKQRSWGRRLLVLFITLVVLAGLGFGGVFAWKHRPVSVHVNGQQRTVFKRSTYAQLFESEKPEVAPGDYVAVTGEVLEAGKGNPYSVTSNGVELPFDELESRVIWGDENIVFGDGANVCEPYDSEMVEEEPRLEYRVAPGTPQKGYLVQQGVVQYVVQWPQRGRYEQRTGKETGKTAKGEVQTETKNLVVQAQNISPDGGEKLVALTFDDGPSYYTEPYLEILKKYDVKATFSVIGEQLADGGPVVAETAQAGHQIMSHSWTHRQLTALDEGELAHELADTATTIQEYTGAYASFVRAPYGDMDEGVWLRSKGAVSATVYWTHDSSDWEQPGVDEIVSNCTGYMAPGSVILMHDGGGYRDQDLEALPLIIEAWMEAGYRFVTLQELMESDSSIATDCLGPAPEGLTWPTQMVEAGEDGGNEANDEAEGEGAAEGAEAAQDAQE